MQIKFQQGMTIDDMISSLQELKQQELNDYDILKTDATLYINLKNNDNLICPKNELEYYAYKNGRIIDTIANLKEKAHNDFYQTFIDSLEYMITEEERLNSSLNKAQKHLEKAQAKKTKTIEKWESEIKQIKEKLSTTKKAKPILEDILTNINKENINFHSIVDKEKSKYRNTIKIGVYISFIYKDKIMLFGNYYHDEYKLYVVNDISNIPLHYYVFYQ